MDRRLTRGPWRAAAGRRRVVFAAIVAAVALLHAALTREIADASTAFAASQAMAERLTATYVRTIEPEAPPRVAPRPLATATAIVAVVAARAPRRAARADRSASAVEPAAPVIAQAEAPIDVAPVAPAEPADTTLADAPAASPAFEWPASTRITYALTGNFRGELSGQAQVEWVRLGDRYQVHLDLFAGPEFAPIFSRRMTSEGRIGADGLVPERYDEDTQAIFRERRRVTVGFEADAVVLANGQRRDRLAGVQDTASQFVQFSFLFSTRPELLRTGNTFELPLALPRGMDSWVYDVLDEETLATPFGPLAAFHLKPRRPVPKNGELTAEIWFAPALRFLPVRIRIQQDAATFIDLMIASKPEMAAP